MSPSKAAAEYFADSNTQTERHGGSVVVEGHLLGRLLEMPKPMADYTAIAEIAKQVGAYDSNTGIYDTAQVAKELKARGIVGFKFKDKNAGNRIAYAIVDDSAWTLGRRTHE